MFLVEQKQSTNERAAAKTNTQSKRADQMGTTTTTAPDQLTVETQPNQASNRSKHAYLMDNLKPRLFEMGKSVEALETRVTSHF